MTISDIRICCRPSIGYSLACVAVTSSSSLVQGVAAMVNKHAEAQNPGILPLTMSTGQI